MTQAELPDFGTYKKIALKRIVKQGFDYFRNHHLSTKGSKMSFKFMPYLHKIYLEESPLIAIQSSVQTGKSEWALIRGLACVGLGMNVFHVFSTGEAKNSFVKSRINELCDKVPVYKAMEKDDRRNMYLRNMGEANWKFVISNSKSHFDEFPADVAIVDEYDSCNPENVLLIDTRLDGSNYKFQWFVGNPTVSNMGVSQFYDKSTQNKWHFRCRDCNELMESDFFSIVVNETKDKDGNHISYHLYDTEWNETLDRDILIKCPHCESMQTRGKGKWVEKNPGARIAGYHISKMMKLNSEIREIWEELKEAEGNDYKLQVLYNKKLGLPYSGTGAKVTAEMLDRCAYEYVPKDSSNKPTIAGLDIGSKFDMQIDIAAKHEGKKKKLMLNAFRLNTLEDVKAIIEQFNVRTLCVGVKPERHLAKQLRDDMFGKCEVILIEEVEGRSGNLKLFGFKEDEENGVITTDRTWLLDEAIKNIKMRNVLVPREFRGLLSGYWLRSMESITRVFQNEKEEYKWSKADTDHFCFANAFSTIAWMRDQNAIIIGDDDLEKTQKKTHDERGNRIIEPVERKERIGIMRERYAGLRKGWSRRRRG